MTLVIEGLVQLDSNYCCGFHMTFVYVAKKTTKIKKCFVHVC